MVGSIVDLAALSKDTYFWAGLILFTGSAGGIFWILNVLHQESGSQNFEPPRRANAPDSPPLKDPLIAALEALSQHINQLEETIHRMDQKLAPPNPQIALDTSQELKALIQFLKSNQPGSTNPSTAQMSAKIDKIYQVLTSLSSPASDATTELK